MESGGGELDMSLVVVLLLVLPAIFASCTSKQEVESAVSRHLINHVEVVLRRVAVAGGD